jgi:hypothetical protein
MLLGGDVSFTRMKSVRIHRPSTGARGEARHPREPVQRSNGSCYRGEPWPLDLERMRSRGRIEDVRHPILCHRGICRRDHLDSRCPLDVVARGRESLGFEEGYSLSHMPPKSFFSTSDMRVSRRSSNSNIASSTWAFQSSGPVADMDGSVSS